jgi:hypothetical protein
VYVPTASRSYGLRKIAGPDHRLVLGYGGSNTAVLLKRFLARADQLIARVPWTSSMA